MCILHTHLKRTVINAGGDGADGAWDVLSSVQNFLADVAVDCVVDLRNGKRMRSGIAVGKFVASAAMQLTAWATWETSWPR